MTTEQTITIHHEPPAETLGVVMAYSKIHGGYYLNSIRETREGWGRTYTAWYDPQVGEPVKPRRYVIERMESTGLEHLYKVADTKHRYPVAQYIPTREAAQAIADIYERAAEGGEA